MHLQTSSRDADEHVKQSKVNTNIAVRNQNYHTATGNHMPYGITQCYLPPGSGDFPAFTPAEACTRFSDQHVTRIRSYVIGTL